MYIIFDETIIDSEEIKDLIQQKSDFKVEKDMCKATKREDVLAYLVTLDVDLIEKQIREEYDLQDMEMEDLFEEYMELAEEKALELEELMPMYSIMEAKAYLRDLRITPRKVKIVLDLIRGKDAATAVAILQNTPNAPAAPVLKLLKSAMANAENNHNMDVSKLYVKTCYVDPAKTMKRVMARARGSADRILKRSSHITMILAEKE